MSTINMPTLGSKGRYTFRAPFDNYNSLNTEFTCKQLSKLSEFLSLGNNPLDTIYKKHNIESVYDKHTADDITIVTLTASTGITLHIPLNYIESTPITDGVAYAGKCLVVNMGAVPLAQNLDNAKEVIKDALKNTLGLEVTIDEVLYTPTTIVDNASHDLVQVTRQQKKDTSPSDAEKLIKLQTKYDILIIKLKELEKWVIERFV